MKFHGCLPDGTITYNTKTYSAAWRKLAKAVSKNLPGLDLHPLGYDPGITFARGKYGSLSMDVQLCQAIARLKT